MRCIGDEIHNGGSADRGAAAAMPAGWLLRSAAIGALCAGLGYHVAQSRAPRIGAAAHLAALAPPLVVVTRLAE